LEEEQMAAKEVEALARLKEVELQRKEEMLEYQVRGK